MGQFVYRMRATITCSRFETAFNYKPQILETKIEDFPCLVKFMFSRKATKIDKILTVDLMLCSKRQIDGEDFVNFRGLLRQYELYINCL